MIYKFIDDKGTFTVRRPRAASYLYFPLTNKNGTFLSSISPNFAGDIKQDNDHFLTPPASIEDIGNNLLCRREFFLTVLSPGKRVVPTSEYKNSVLTAGMLYQTVTQRYPFARVEITHFIPYDLHTEVTYITVTNTGKKLLKFMPTSFLPLYGRSERNLRDHRHVSSLLNRVMIKKYGIILKPTMVFNEKGHTLNTTSYFGFGYEGNTIAPKGQFPTLESFCGEGGNLSRPGAIYGDSKPITKKNSRCDGKEACAALRFSEKTLKASQSAVYVLVSGIASSEKEVNACFAKLNTPEKVRASFEKTKQYWQKTAEYIRYESNNKTYNGWLKWVSIQPMLRKLFGCSFLPHFDYGKGGRGWRDLWQDALNLLLVEPKTTRRMILDNFKGVRIDGSNATIITRNNGFLADRNKISRIWMDHGVWPYLTLKEYIDRTGDIKILLAKTAYFRDGQLMRGQELVRGQDDTAGCLRTRSGNHYQGSVLEHILIETLVQYYNVGKHGFTRLENGDWNDGLDMAAEKGESITFTCMYSYVMNDLCRFLEKLSKKQKTVFILKELLPLLTASKDNSQSMGPRAKQQQLSVYLEKTKWCVEGKQQPVEIDDLVKILSEKSRELVNRIRKTEWLREGFYNGYYDNTSKRTEGRVQGKIRMMLASQVFAIMSGVATKSQIYNIWSSICRYLKDASCGGFRLNTEFKTPYPEFGRAFGFSYGDKENGAFFNHMTTLLAYSLFEKDFAKQGHEVFSSVYRMCTSDKGKIYPMIPEYFNHSGRGLYGYLTGSASWYIHTLLRGYLGIKPEMGNLIVNPPRLKELCKSSPVVTITFLGRRIQIIYPKTAKRCLKISKGMLGEKSCVAQQGKILIPGNTIAKLNPAKTHALRLLI